MLRAATGLSVSFPPPRVSPSPSAVSFYLYLFLALRPVRVHQLSAFVHVCVFVCARVRCQLSRIIIVHTEEECGFPFKLQNMSRARRYAAHTLPSFLRLHSFPSRSENPATIFLLERDIVFTDNSVISEADINLMFAHMSTRRSM